MYYNTANKYLYNPTKYTQGGLDAVESYLLGIPSTSKTGYGVAGGTYAYKKVKKAINYLNEDKR